MPLLVSFVCLLCAFHLVQGEIVIPTCSGDGENVKAFAHFNGTESTTSLLCPGASWLQLFKNADLQSAAQGSVVLSHYGYKMVSVGFAKGYDFAKWFQVFAPNTNVGPSQWYQALKTTPSAANITQLCGACGECKIKPNSSSIESKEADPAIHFVGIDLNRESIALVQSVVCELRIPDSLRNKTITFDFMHGIVGSPFLGKEMTVRNCPAGDESCKIMAYKNANLSKEGYGFVPVLNLNEVLLNVGMLYEDNHRRLLQQEPQEVWRQRHTPHVSVATRPAQLPQQIQPLPHPAQNEAILANLRTQQHAVQQQHVQHMQHPVTHPDILANPPLHQHVHTNPQHHQVHPEHAHMHSQSLHTSQASASLSSTRSSHSTLTSLQRAQLASKQFQSGVITSPAQESTAEHLRSHTGTVTPPAPVHVPKIHVPKPNPGSDNISHPPPPPMLPTTFASRAEVIDLLHISAGGLEAQVLQTCEPAFAARRVRAVTFEFGNSSMWMQATLRRVVKDLSTHHYECYLQGQKGLWPISGTCWNDDYHTRESQGMVLCVLRSDPWLEAIQPLVVTGGGPALVKENNLATAAGNSTAI